MKAVGPFPRGMHIDIKVWGIYKPSRGHTWTLKFKTHILDLILGY